MRKTAYVFSVALISAAVGLGAQQLFGTGPLKNHVLLADAPGFGTYRSPAFKCDQMRTFVPWAEYVRLSSGRSESALDVPEGAEIDPSPHPGLVAEGHLILYTVACSGYDIPQSLRGGDPREARIAWQDPNTGVWRMGPVVMAFDWISDEHLVTAFGSGSLWMYAPDTSVGSVTLRISETTGQVVQVVRTPFVDRAIAVANDDGLWLYGGDQGIDTTRITVFHVTPGSPSVSVLRNRPLVANGPLLPRN